MIDFEVFDSHDETAYMPLFAYFDPTNFESVIEEEKLKDAMDIKIKSIGKSPHKDTTTLKSNESTIARRKAKWINIKHV